MAKAIKTVFYCQQCGNESAKWVGQCPACKAWNTMVEEPVKVMSASRAAKAGAAGGGRGISAGLRPVSLSEVDLSAEPRVRTGIGELDRVLGGGLVPVSLVLLGGDPGIGKSTLLLQMSAELAKAGKQVLYVSGEESLRQIGLRAERLGGVSGSLKFLCATELDQISESVLAMKPFLVVIDSIQTMYNPEVSSAPGSVSQVRETTGVLMRLAKENGITFFIVGHVTKDQAPGYWSTWWTPCCTSRGTGMRFTVSFGERRTGSAPRTRSGSSR